MGSWDTDNGFPSWISGKTNYFRFNTTSSDYKPALTITYTLPLSGVSFSMNQTSGSPILPVAFTDENTNSPSAWSWSHTDVTNTTLVETVFSHLTKSRSRVRSGNWSIQLNVTNAGGYNKSSANTSWVNISAGNMTGVTIPAGFEFFPNDYIYNVPIDTLPVHPNSSIYINNQTDGHDVGMWIASSGIPINVYNSSLTKSNFTNISYTGFSKSPGYFTDNGTVSDT